MWGCGDVEMGMGGDAERGEGGERKQTNQPLRDGHGQMDMVNVSLLGFTYCSIYSTKPNPYERI